MQKPDDTNHFFGLTRVISGKRINGKWRFQLGLEFMHEKDHFSEFKENNFENISRLSRYDVLTSGNPAINGCKIDENIWFVQMKD